MLWFLLTQHPGELDLGLLPISVLYYLLVYLAQGVPLRSPSRTGEQFKLCRAWFGVPSPENLGPGTSERA